ncbi:hypothetical protein I316_01043 [Kwoniella heveanensis BCC8398]|uniref:Zn(2)-C6 fungal-type domain-containing protein n=1 Tax=Kwoniella heveanensis BCC8398 TaxID=1296120 RepID=A0A1B9H1I1_9TREE|nr:hypothetical protein I316_01043 [Kwoniella heveanensis BCC8398]
MSSAPIEARAKRTHARRSCDVCKVRKTRCELPDLDVPAGPTPLSLDKSCHRCRVLALPCIVDDGGKKQKKRVRDDGDNGASVGNQTLASIDAPAQSTPGEGKSKSKIAAGSTSKRRSAKKNASQKADESSNGTTISNDRLPAILNHALDLIHGISPLAKQPASLHEAAHPQPDAPGHDEPSETNPSYGMKLHGRPAELTCAMLKVAYGKIQVKRSGPFEEEDLDLNSVVDEQTKARLQPGFSQLKTYHPHLESLATMFRTYNNPNNQANPAITLLLATVIYLSSLSLPADAAVQRLRASLSPYIIHLRASVLLQLPRSFHALQALEMLAIHCPLGILPLQQANLRTLSVARGQTVIISHMADAVEFDALVESVFAGPGPAFAFECTDVWLWLGLIADRASITLEDIHPTRPDDLYKARRIVDEFSDYGERSDFWQDGIRRGDYAALVGRLGVCDRVARLDDVLSTLQRLKGALDTSSTDPTFDPVRKIVNEFEGFDKRMEEIDRRHDLIMQHLSEYARGVEAGWAAYRAIRRRYETSKIYVTGLRMLMATHYLPGCPYAYPGLPPHLPPEQAVSYAISKAFNPADIVRFITDTAVSKAAVEAVWDWGRRRGINTEACLVSCAELGQNMVADLQNHVYASIVPLHDVICIANESAKVMIEMEAGTIQILRSTHQLHKAFRARSWLVVMQQVSRTMQSIGLLSPTDGLGGDTLANGCSNLIGSMVRTAEEWTKLLEKEQVSQEATDAQPVENNPHAQPQPQDHQEGQGQTQPAVPPYANGAAHPPHPYEPIRQPSVASHQQYMDTSDRWMASNETSQQPHTLSQAQAQHGHTPSGSAQQQHQPMDQQGPRPSQQQPLPYHPPPQFAHGHQVQGQGQPYNNTALDQLLSQMFGYSVAPSDGSQQQHHQQHSHAHQSQQHQNQHQQHQAQPSHSQTQSNVHPDLQGNGHPHPHVGHDHRVGDTQGWAQQEMRS